MTNVTSLKDFFFLFVGVAFIFNDLDSLEFSPLIQECCKIYNPLAGVLWNYASSKPLGNNTFLWFTVSNTDIIQAKILVKLTTLPHIHHLLLENPAWFLHSCNSCSDNFNQNSTCRLKDLRRSFIYCLHYRERIWESSRRRTFYR